MLGTTAISYPPLLYLLLAAVLTLHTSVLNRV